MLATATQPRSMARVGRDWWRGLVLVLLALPAGSAPSAAPLIRITKVQTSESWVILEVRNDAGQALAIVDAKVWNHESSLKIGLRQTGLLGAPLLASNDPPDSIGALGPVRWIDRPDGVSEELPSGETAMLTLRVPPHSGLVRYHVVVFVRSGSRFRTEFVSLPVIGRFHLVGALLFLLFVITEAWTMALRPRGTP
jgi:hypothetical protein